MDEEGAVDNVNQNNEEIIKKKKKKKKKDKNKSAKSVVEAYTADTVKAAESAKTSQNEGISEVKRDYKGGKEKKKMKKSKGAEDAKADMKIGSRKGDLNVVACENGGGLKIDKAERNGESSSGLRMDNAERKRNRREKKDKNEIVETHDTDKVKRDESTNWQERENVSGKVSGKEVMKEKKKQKVKRNESKVGEKDGEVIRGDSENCIVNATEIRKEKKDKKKKDYSFVRSKDTHNENKSDEVGLSSKRQENVLHDVEGHTPSTNEDGDTKTNHERKKKKKHKKKENYKDDLPPAQQEYVDSDTKSLLNTTETQNNEAEVSNKRKKKKTTFLENGSNDERDNEAEYAKKGKKRKASLVVKGSDDTSPNKSNKKVRFSDQDEVFPLPPKSNTEEGNGEKDNLVIGKRFIREEDEVVKGCVEDVDWDDLIDTGSVGSRWFYI